VDKPQRLALKQEQLTAELHGGRLTPASGTGRGVKNDVRTPEWSIEVKSTSGLGYRIDRDTLQRSEHNALKDGRRLLFVIAFLWPGRAKRYVIMSEDDHLEREAELARLRDFYETRRIV
jgi:hypothetical protein